MPTEIVEPEGRKNIPKTILDEYFSLEAELLEENNTEQARFFDTYSLLELGLSMLREYLLAKDIDPEQKEFDADVVSKWGRYIEDFKACDNILAGAHFNREFAQERVSTKMSPKESISYNYQLLTSRGRRACVRIRSDLMRLEIIPREDEEGAERRIVLRAADGRR